MKKAWFVQVREDYSGCDLIKGTVTDGLSDGLFTSKINDCDETLLIDPNMIFHKKKHAKGFKRKIDDYLKQPEAQKILDGDIIATGSYIWGDNEIFMDLGEYIGTLSSLRSVGMSYAITYDGDVFEHDHQAIDKKIESIAKRYQIGIRVKR